MIRYTVQQLTALAISALLAAGCSDRPEVVRPTASWSLGEPDLVIGSQLSGAVTFTSVTDVLVAHDGSLFVLEQGVPRILALNPDGQPRGEIGRPGEGPGELSRPARIGLLGDTLWILDTRLRRLSRFLGSDLISSEPLPEVPQLHPERNSRISDLLADGRFLLTSDVWLPPDAPDAASTPGVLATGLVGGLDTIALINVDYVGGVLIHEVDGEIAAISVFQQPFSESSDWDVSSAGSMVAISETTEAGYRVAVVGLQGDTAWTVDLNTSRTPVPPRVVDSIVDAETRGSFTSTDVREALFTPTNYPAATGVKIQSRDTVWVRRETAADAMRWDVVTPNGRVATVAMPAGFELLVPSMNHLIGVVKDEFDVPYVIRLPIARN